MSNTVDYGDGIISITNIDENWLWTSIMPNKKTMRIDSIQFNPGTANDVCVFKSRSTAGTPFFDVICANVYDQKVKPFFGRQMRPVFDFAASTISSGAKIIILFSD